MAAGMAAFGKEENDRAGSPVPQDTVGRIKDDITEIKETAKR
ncbi:hypothetical protein [Streptomyces sp. NPDC018693]